MKLLSFEERASRIFSDHYRSLAKKVDRMFGMLLTLEWILGILLALLISPRTWAGDQNQIHLHIYAAIFTGGLIASLPVYLVLTNPGAKINRYVVAVAQMFFSMLLIHLTGGRIETHFHVFGSLAFLAFYRDWKVIAIATVITGLDHVVRGLVWPESVYGVLSATPWRALEHAAWVIFEDVFLLYSIKEALRELRTMSENEVRLQNTVETVENQVNERTRQLQESQKIIVDQQKALISTAKMSALGEMAAGIAHEINNPLTVILGRASQLTRKLGSGPVEPEQVVMGLKKIEEVATRISVTVAGLRTFARAGETDPLVLTSFSQILAETVELCRDKLNFGEIELRVKASPPFSISCRPVQISQVLINLISNAHDAILTLPERWIEIESTLQDGFVEITVTDSGSGIPREIAEKMMEPFFTTKEVNKGTGLGLSISKGIVETHEGTLQLDANSPHTRFVIRLPAVTDLPLRQAA